MQTREKTHPFINTGRMAGFLYLLLAITAFYAIMYVPTQIIVKGNAAATTGKMLANEFLFRTGIVSHLISETLFIFLVLHLYRLLKPINERRAKLMVTLVMVQIPIVFLVESFSITSLLSQKANCYNHFLPCKDKIWPCYF